MESIISIYWEFIEIMRAEKSENVGGDAKNHITPLFYTHMQTC